MRIYKYFAKKIKIEYIYSTFYYEDNIRFSENFEIERTFLEIRTPALK